MALTKTNSRGGELSNKKKYVEDRFKISPTEGIEVSYCEEDDLLKINCWVSDFAKGGGLDTSINRIEIKRDLLIELLRQLDKSLSDIDKY